MIRGWATPMSHQAEDVDRLSYHPRINIWNGLGTGKTATLVWWLARLWESGAIDEVWLTLPGMCLPDWRSTFEGMAMPEELVEFIDCRPPDVGLIEKMITSSLRAPGHKLRVYCTTYGGTRKLLNTGTKGRPAVDPAQEILKHVRGRRIAAVYDEAQATALHSSAQGLACRALGHAASHVASVTATPIGRDVQLRLWGLTNLVRPDLLLRHEPELVKGKPVAPKGSFNAFKYRYAHCNDPMEGRPLPGGGMRSFNIHRSYPVSVYTDMIQREVLEPMAPFTTRRKKEDCLDLPPKVYIARHFQLRGQAARAMRGLIEDDRAVLDSGHAVVPPNVLIERLRTLELTGGWLEGHPVHDGKLALLRDVLRSIEEDIGEREPRHIWASRSREVVACALIATGATPVTALQRATDVYPPGANAPVSHEYADVIRVCRKSGVGIIHGPTSDRDRDKIQADWRAGKLHTVVAHPGVAGAGLNWQHSKAAVYYSPPLGTIARRQSEDRVHRKGLKHTALIYDLMVEDGPDEAVVMAHVDQRDAALVMLDWLSERIRS